MKKIILLVITLIGFTNFSHAQSLKFGVKGGVNFSSIRGNQTSLTQGRTGFHIGVVGELGISDKFSIQPEVLYSSQGFSPKIGDLDTKIDYVNLPILVKYKFLKFFNAYAGPQFGVKVSEGKDLKNLTGDTESFDMSAALGAGVKFSKFFAQIRYNVGLTNTNASNAANAPNIKNTVFQLSVGYYIF